MRNLLIILQSTVVLLWILETKLVRCESWVAKPLSKALWGFSPSPMNNSLCSEHSSIYKQHLANLSLWAVQMLDASSLAPNGLVAGDTHQLGHFDSCMATRGPVKPQFCVPTIWFQPFSNVFPTFNDGNYSRGFEEDDGTSSLPIWEKMKPNPDASKQRRDRLHWGLCLPASCRPFEIQSELNETLNSLSAESQIHFQVSLNDIKCYNPHAEFSDRYTGPEKSAGFYIMCYLLAILGLILVIATVTDILLGVERTHGDDSSTRRMNETYKRSLFLQLYSVRLNLERLTRKDKSSEFDILNGMKFVLLFFVVTGHRGLFNMGTALSDPEYVESLYRSIPYLGVMNGNYMVDGYLTISGFLTFHKVYRMLSKTKQFNFMQLVLYRWLRIIPVYMFIVAFYALLLPHLGRGPLWLEQTVRESDRCQQNWWTNLLFINNYVRADDQCLLVSWYLACDLHFFILGSLLVFLIWLQPTFAWITMLSAFSISIAIPFTITYAGNYYGILRSYTYFYADPVKWFDFYALYGKTHNRAAPYVTGIITGYITQTMLDRKLQIPPKIKLWMTVLLILIIFPLLFMSSLFYLYGYNALMNAVYASTHRVLYACFLNWLIVIQVTTGWEVLSGLLCSPWFIPFSRLSLCALLIHPLLQLYSVATLRSSEFYTYSKGYYVGTADIFVSFFFSLFLYLSVEAPCSTLQNIIFGLLLGKKDGRKSKVEKNDNGVHIAHTEENTRV